RGGELAKPDLVAPGVAYSTVPRWDAGDEVKQGTSMAAPQVAGIAALLLSALREEGRGADGAAIRRALMVTATPVAAAGLVEGGRGVPGAEAAYQWLRRAPRMEGVEVTTPGGGDAALLLLGPNGRPVPAAEFLLRRDSAGARTYRLRSDVPWLRAPARVELRGAATVRIALDPALPPGPGVVSGVVSGWTEDTLAGPAFQLPVTVVRPAAPAPGRAVLQSAAHVAAGGILRSPFLGDSARPFEVRITAGGTDQAFAFLHEPGGRPFRNGGVLPLVGGQPAVFRVNGEDAIPGAWEAVVSASASAGATTTVEVLEAPVALRLGLTGARTVTARVANHLGSPVRAEVGAALQGAELVREVVGQAAAQRDVAIQSPAWARQLVVELEMEPRQWGRFTDFGVTVFDSAGRRLEAEPMQYAVGRLTLPLPPGADRTLRLALLPGLADPADTGEWRVRLSVRALAAAEVALALARPGAGTVTIAAADSVAIDFELPALPWTLADGYAPLCRVSVGALGGRWSRQAGLAVLHRNTMR
ncbi:MAG TPA: S8 family serine peptidase, partial [Gemmatimonadales bacterium]|nr:S8 family serine peptidase [Gemmatimonadales bacterium]